MRKRNIIERSESEVNDLEKEYNELYEAQRNLGFIPLLKPVRNGWTRSLILREDIGRSNGACIVQEALTACQYSIWGRDHNHVDRNWKKRLKNNLRIVFPGVELLDSNAYGKLSNKAQKHFVAVNYSWSRWSEYDRYFLCLIPKYSFVSIYTRSYLTKQKVTDNVIESRMQEINEILLSNKYYKYSWNAFSNRNRWNERDKYHLFTTANDEKLRDTLAAYNSIR